MTGQGWIAAAIVAVPFAAVWLGMAIWRPMAPCRWCRGRGRVGDRERWRNIDCRHCGNSRERMTAGAKLVRGLWGRAGWGK